MFNSIFKAEVLCTDSMADLIDIERLLGSNNIKFKRKSINRISHGFNSTRNIIGSVGERSELSNQYYLYVNRKDKEETDYLINEWRRKN